MNKETLIPIKFVSLAYSAHLSASFAIENYIEECPRYDDKPSDGEASDLEIWGMQRAPSLSLFPDPFWLLIKSYLLVR